MMRPELENVPELLQHIQSRLPVTEAARTSVLSKSWLHAWSTIPTLRFDLRNRENGVMKLVDVDRTLIRYLRDNTPIESFELAIDIENQESASHAEKWIGPVATKTCLREISLHISHWGASFMLPYEILASENLTKITVTGLQGSSHSIRWTTTPVINCLSLRKLHLEGCVHISEEMLHNIFSSCRLLLRIRLLGSTCKGFKTLKVKNLPLLYELRIDLDGRHSTALEISEVPNLGVFSCDLKVPFWLAHLYPPHPFNEYPISIGSRLTHLMLGGLITDNACLDIFKSGEFHFLVNLTLQLTSWMPGSFNLTCASIKSLYLLRCPYSLIDVQVHAQKLVFFKLGGRILPSLLFPVSSLKQMIISISVNFPVDANFFLKMRETLTLSHYCNLSITIDNSKLPFDIDIDDLRTRLLFPPARNVQQLFFETTHDECLWERSPFFDAFFEICHPKIVFANRDMLEHNNHFCRVMLREVLDKKTTTGTPYWPHYLKHVQIRHKSTHQQWKTLTNSHRNLLGGSASDLYVQFKLKWQQR